MKSFLDIIKNRKILFRLAKNDFKNKFAGSYLGVIWAFVQPVVIVSIYWIIFEKGLRSRPLPEMPDFPYLLWLIAGMCPWFLINDIMNQSTNCLVEYGYIVKKMKFNIDMIPLIKVISNAFVHLFFIALVCIVYVFYGKIPTMYGLQVFYYSFCVLCFSTSIVYFTSAINVFFRDMAQIVGVVMQYAMWVLPIMLSESQYPDFMKPLIKFNPMYYAIEGYRDAFIRNIGFWEKPWMTLYFWVFTIVLFIIGRVVFNKMKPHFADVM
ncbi:MAG: ABC transporter permease [Lachnospira sp.]